MEASMFIQLFATGMRFDSRKRVSYSTELGEWENNLVLDEDGDFRICSTLETNYTMTAGSADLLTIRLNFPTGPVYHLTSRRHEIQILLRVSLDL